MPVEIGLADNIVTIFTRILMGIAFMKAFTVAAIAVATFTFLNMFLSKQLLVAKVQYMGAKESTLLWNAILLLVGTIGPVAIIISTLFFNEFNLGVILFMIVIAMASGGWFGRRLRLADPTNRTYKRNVLILESIGIVLTVVSDNIARWVQKSIIGTINLVIEVIHGPFVMYYAIISIIINALLSYALTKVMGSSEATGQLNMVGSMIGGLVHAWYSRKSIAKLAKDYEDNNLKEEKADETTTNTNTNTSESVGI